MPFAFPFFDSLFFVQSDFGMNVSGSSHDLVAAAPATRASSLLGALAVLQRLPGLGPVLQLLRLLGRRVTAYVLSVVSMIGD